MAVVPGAAAVETITEKGGGSDGNRRFTCVFFDGGGSRGWGDSDNTG